MAPQAMGRFWTMLAHYHGQVWNGNEVKYQDAPKLTRSMRISMEDLKLQELLVVYPGSREYALADNIRAVPLAKACGAPAGI